MIAACVAFFSAALIAIAVLAGASAAPAFALDAGSALSATNIVAQGGGDAAGGSAVSGGSFAASGDVAGGDAGGGSVSGGGVAGGGGVAAGEGDISEGDASSENGDSPASADETPASATEETGALDGQDPVANVALSIRAKALKGGWKKAATSGKATGNAKKGISALGISLTSQGNAVGSIRYRLYSTKAKWTPTAKDGAIAKTRNNPATAMRIWLAGKAAKRFDVYYRVYLKDYGWLDWAQNKQVAGTTKLASCITRVQVKLVAKGEKFKKSTAFYRLKNRWEGIEFKYRDDESVEQLLEVKHTGGVKATVVLREKEDGEWRTGLSCKGYVGRKGIGEAHEWVARTPEGDFGITSAFGIRGNPGSNLPYLQVTSAHYWCADRSHYNQLININESPHDCTGEHLIDYDPHYNYGLFFDYNTNPVRYGAGSAFFVHCTGPGSTGGTGGCVAVSESNMVSIIRTLTDGARLCIYPK